MNFWGWVQAIATGWFVLSLLLGIAWVLGSRRIFRKPPAPPQLKRRVYDGESGDAAIVRAQSGGDL